MFSDVSFLTQNDHITSAHIYSLCMRKLRAPHPCRFKFDFETIVNDESHCVTIISTQTIHQNLCYFEVDFILPGYFNLIYVGVTSNKSISLSELQKNTSKETVALVSTLSARIPNQNLGCEKIRLKKQDVISVIVDYSADEILFYRNSVYMGIGLIKPSSMRNLYPFIVTWTDTTAHLVERYTYGELHRS
jgi:hypothetical protein